METAIRAAQASGLQVYLDTVLNHKGGADGTETTTGTPVSNDNRNIEIGPSREIDGWTLFNFAGRGSTHSSFQWHWWHFDAIDYDQRTGNRAIFRLRDKTFETPVDPERGNYDYLMFADLDMSRDDVRAEVGAWGDWIVRSLGIDGFRLDAVRHIRFPFFIDWLDRVRNNAALPLFAVGEYFSGNVATLRWFIEQTGRRMSLFDFPLHFSMRDVARGDGLVDIARIFDGTLVAQDPELAVTFVDNHDTWQQDRRDEAIRDWFLPHAYALILLREAGYPCVFYPDYYGGGGRTSLRLLLDALLAARRDHAYGPQTDWFDDSNFIGWTRAGDEAHPRGLAMVLTDSAGGVKRMPAGRPGAVFSEITGSVAGTVTIGADGTGAFRRNERGIAVWIEQS